MLIDFTEFFKDQSLEETIQVLDEMLTILVIHTEQAGLAEGLSHQYLTIKYLKELLEEYQKLVS